MRLSYRSVTSALAAAALLAAVWQSHVPANARTASKSFGVYVNVQPAATVSLSGSTFIWNSVKTTMQGYALADNGAMTVTGAIRTAPTGGASSIVVLSPGNIVGDKNGFTLPINQFALTCSGTSNVGTQPTYAPALTKLKANSSVPCASWGAGANTQLHFSFALYLQTQAVQKAVYQSQSFSVIATAT
jgi:hypothetical protein